MSGMRKSLEQWKEDVLVKKIARTCHAANREWCHLHGDHSQLPWEMAPNWQQDSAIAGVADCFLNMRVKTPKESHEAWRAHKLASGWKHGPIKDGKRKEHPCMVEWGDLPFEQRMKDHIFTSIVKAFLEG